MPIFSPELNNLHEENTRLLGVASANAQFVEEAIKLYLQSAFDLIRKKLDNALPFTYTYDTIKNSPMGNLNKFFSFYNDNEELKNMLQPILEERNYIAHRAYLLKEEQTINKELMEQENNRINKFIEQTHLIIFQIFEEKRKLDKQLE